MLQRHAGPGNTCVERTVGTVQWIHSCKCEQTHTSFLVMVFLSTTCSCEVKNARMLRLWTADSSLELLIARQHTMHTNPLTVCPPRSHAQHSALVGTCAIVRVGQRAVSLQISCFNFPIGSLPGSKVSLAQHLWQDKHLFLRRQTPELSYYPQYVNLSMDLYTHG